MHFTEELFEQAVIELLQKMDYTHIYAPDMGRTDFSSPLMESALLDSLVRIIKNCPLKQSMKRYISSKTLKTVVLFKRIRPLWAIYKTVLR